MDLCAKSPSELLVLEVLTLYGVWSKIFDELFKSSPSNLVSCSEVCQEWKDLLESKRTTYLMSVAFSHISKLLATSDIQNCRLVCQSWNIAVNEFLSNFGKGITGFPIYFENNASYTEKIVDIMASTAVPVGSSINPFVSWKIILNLRNFSESPDDLKFQTTFLSLLARFGSEIRTFVYAKGLHDEIQEGQSLLTYKLLRSYLEYLPNLEHLNFGGSVFYNQEVSTLTDIKTLLREEPLPKLDHLSVVTMFHPNILVAQGILLAYGNQLQDHILYFTFGGHSLAQFLKTVFPIQMRELKYLSIRAVERKEDILIMYSVKWPIKYLTLRYKADTVKVETVFKVVSHFGDTLKQLILIAAGDHGFDEFVMATTTPTRVYSEKNVRLNLPHLRYLWIDDPSICFKTVDFLLPCGALQKWKLEMMGSSSSTPGLGERTLTALERYSAFGCFGSGGENRIKLFGNGENATSMYKSYI
ncbi:unnamed protein product [Orchesella dallaii]|uniref:F-box domain-containing protein n=1 Tax=Orchesella dallaii TaxID=48710 RepID=A0ABP1RZH4_9HEXA